MYEEAIAELKQASIMDIKNKLELALKIVQLCRNKGMMQLAKQAFDFALRLDETLYKDYILFIVETQPEEELTRLHTKLSGFEENLALFASCFMKTRPIFKPKFNENS